MYAKAGKMKRHVLKGKVITGLGKGKMFVKIYSNILLEECGFTPFLGTLNITLDEISDIVFDGCIEGFEINGKPYGGLAYKHASINEIACVIIKPVLTKHSSAVIELIAPMSLREALHLSDGDRIEVTV